MSAEIQKRILLVEDNAATAAIEKKFLEKYGYNVLTACDGEEAIARFKAGVGIDLVLMDIDLGGGMDGTEAAKKILHEHDIPIVFLSSHIEPEIVEKTEKITSYGYAVKGSGATVIDASIKMAFKLFEANRETKKNELQYKELFEKSVNGIGLYEIILNEKGEPVDFIFLKVNPAFEKHTGMKAEDIINKRVTEVHEGVEETGLIQVFGKVAITGEPISFDTFLNRCSGILIFPLFRPA